MPIESLADVRVFRQIVASGSIAAAARVMGDNKNRLSQRLVALERALGTRLADRTTRSFRLTDEGQRFYETSELLLDAAERSEAAVAPSDSVEGHVRVSLYSALASAGIGLEIAHLMQSAPGLHLQVAVVDGEADVLSLGIDLAVQVGPLPDSSLVGKRLGIVSYAMAASPSYLRNYGTPQSLNDLKKHECIRRLSTDIEHSWSLVGRTGRRVVVPIGGRLECSDARLQAEILYGGFGIGLRPAAEVRRATEAGSLIPILPKWTLAPISVWVVCPKGRLRLQRFAPVVEILTRAVARLS